MLSGVTSVIWLEGINDLSSGASAEAVIAGFKEGVRRLRARGLRVIGGTITSSVGATTASGTPENDAKRKTINEFIRTGGLFDGVVDFDAATRDPQTGALKEAFNRTARPAAPAIACIPTVPAITRWATPSILGCSCPAAGSRISRRLMADR